MQDQDPSLLLIAPFRPWLDWLDAQARLVEVGLEWQRTAWQPWIDWQASLAVNGFEQFGWPWMLRGEEQLG